MTEIAAPTRMASSRPFIASFGLAVVSAAVVASVLCLGVAAVAHAAGASPQMLALTPTVFVPFIVIGVLGGAIGWSIIRAKARDPRRVLNVLVPVVLLVSFVPDILVGVSRALPGTTWTAVIGLMVMHVVVAACAVAAFRKFLPVPHR
jgi:hypothetical protein